MDRMVPGDVFGEMSLLTGQPRSATISAATDTVVFEIAREHLEPVLNRRPELAEALARVMAERQARNAEQGRSADQPPAGAPAAPEDLLARLRAFFKPL
jgi:CRP-like cAMP-binding protein